MSTASKRQRVVDAALGQAAAGAHYLWGSLGSTPNPSPSGKKEVTFNPKNLNPSKVSFCAAYCERDRPQVCGGRHARRTLPRGYTNPVAATSPLLAEWIAENGHYPETNWDDSLTPRLQKGTGVKEQIVWGEGCDETRHFDCISFVNWCLWQVRADRPTYDMYHYFYSIEDRARYRRKT